METPTISIVMPAYNVAPYIDRAIKCVRAQTFSDWELIVVDDAATDETPRIAEDAAREDGRIRVVHHEANKGLSRARNTGMAAARGAYLWFCDPDDAYDGDLLETCMNAIKANPAQVTVFGVCEEYYAADGRFLYDHRITPENASYASAEALRPHVLDLEVNTCLGYAWNKLYDTGYLRAIRAQFETVPLIEDIAFNIQVFQNLESLNVLPRAPYRYARRLGSNLTNGYLPRYGELMHKRIQLLRDQQEAWALLNNQSKAVLGSLLARYVISEAERNCAPEAHMTHADRRSWCNRVFADPLFRELVPYARPETSRALKIALKPLQQGSVAGTLAFGRAVHIARTRFLPLFTKIKSGR